jgi:NrtR DNA-binding winged helix domain
VKAILGRELDKGAFRRKIADQPTLVPVPGEFLRGPQRPVRLYRVAGDFKFQLKAFALTLECFSSAISCPRIGQSISLVSGHSAVVR